VLADSEIVSASRSCGGWFYKGLPTVPLDSHDGPQVQASCISDFIASMKTTRRDDIVLTVKEEEARGEQEGIDVLS
jgi:hypothetical protein